MFAFKQQPRLATALILTILTGGLAACSSGGGGAGSAKTDPGLKVTSTTPANGAVNVELDAVLKAEFNKDIFAKSATHDANSIVLQKAGSTDGIAKQVVADTSKSITITPDAPLTLLTNYTVTATDNVTDVDGNPLANKQSWSFTTKNGTWNDTATPVGPSLDSGNAQQKVIVDENGNALAVWLKEDGSPATRNIYASYYDVNTDSWSSSILIQQPTATMKSVRAFDIAFDNDGNAMAVWSRSDDTNRHIFASYRQAASGAWEPAEIINSSGFFLPKVGFDASGNAIAIWHKSTGQDGGAIVYNKYNANTSSWATPKDVANVGVNRANLYSLALATSSNGDAIVLWSQQQRDTEPAKPVFSARYIANIDTWGSKTPMTSQPEQGNVTDLKVVYSRSGDAFATWLRYDRDVSIGKSFVSRFSSSSSGWSYPKWVKSLRPDTDSRSPDIAAFDDGSAALVFQQDTGSFNSSLYSPNTNTWSPLIDIPAPATYNIGAPNIATDSSGNLLLVTTSKAYIDNSTKVFVYRYSANKSSWQNAQSISNGGYGKADDPSIAIDASGRATVTWVDDSYIFANRLTAD